MSLHADDPGYMTMYEKGWRLCLSVSSDRNDDTDGSKETPDEVIVCSQPASTHTHTNIEAHKLISVN